MNSAVGGAFAEQVFKNPEGVGRVPGEILNGLWNGINNLITVSKTQVKDKCRSIQITIINNTQNTLYFQEEYFDSGTNIQSISPKIPSLTVGTALVANKDGSYFTGVSGGMRFKLSNKIYLNIGFSNPYIGSNKFYGQLIKQKKQSKYGYQKCQTNSSIYKDFDNYQLLVVQNHLSDCAQVQFVFTIESMTSEKK